MMDLGLFYDLPAIVKTISPVRAFYGVGPSTPLPTPPTWRARVSLFAWIITFELSGIGDPTSSYATARHSSQGHMTTQASPLRQSRDTYGGWYNLYI
jgi:hypothetical protein